MLLHSEPVRLMTVASPLLDSAMDTELVVFSSTSRMPPSMVGRCEINDEGIAARFHGMTLGSSGLARAGSLSQPDGKHATGPVLRSGRLKNNRSLARRRKRDWRKFPYYKILNSMPLNSNFLGEGTKRLFTG
jgi:hypothetical protein